MPRVALTPIKLERLGVVFSTRLQVAGELSRACELVEKVLKSGGRRRRTGRCRPGVCARDSATTLFGGPRRVTEEGERGEVHRFYGRAISRTPHPAHANESGTLPNAISCTPAS